MARTELELLISVIDQASDELKAVASKLDDTSEAAEKGGKGFQVFQGSMMNFKAALDVARQAAQDMLNVLKQAWNMAELAADADRAATAFTNLSGGALEARDNLDIMMQASGNTLSKMDAMAAASKLMSMGLATNSEELQKVSEMAITLGRAFGRDATQAIDEFSLLLANQSVLRLDTFGISGAKVRARIEELMAATKDMTREQAFAIATFEEGEKAMVKLGGAAKEDAAASFEELSARIMDAKVALGQEFLPAALGVMDQVNTWLQFHAIQDEFDALVKSVRKYNAAVTDDAQKRLNALQDEHGAWVGVTEMQEEVVVMVEEIEKMTRAISESGDAHEDWRLAALLAADAASELAPSIDATAQAVWNMEQRTRAEVEELKAFDSTARTAAGAARDLAAAEQEAADAADRQARITGELSDAMEIAGLLSGTQERITRAYMLATGQMTQEDYDLAEATDILVQSYADRKISEEELIASLIDLKNKEGEAATVVGEHRAAMNDSLDDIEKYHGKLVDLDSLEVEPTVTLPEMPEVQTEMDRLTDKLGNLDLEEHTPVIDEQPITDVIDETDRLILRLEAADETVGFVNTSLTELPTDIPLNIDHTSMDNAIERAEYMKWLLEQLRRGVDVDVRYHATGDYPYLP